MVVVDRYGRTWDLPMCELCAVCRQPDSLGECNHNELTPAEVTELGGRMSREVWIEEGRRNDGICYIYTNVQRDANVAHSLWIESVSYAHKRSAIAAARRRGYVVVAKPK